jgi:kojibiose phosphorylase
VTPKERVWQVGDAPFQPGKLHHTETIYTIGNGYMGLRGTFEEGYPGEIVSTLVHGIYNHPADELVPDLVNIPNPLPLTIEVDGERFAMNNGEILGYERTLDLEKAILTRGVLWRNSKGAIVALRFERFASLEIEPLIAQRLSIRSLVGTCSITVTASIDGTQTNSGVAHWGTLTSARESGAGHAPHIVVEGVTGQSGYRVAVGSTLISPAGSATASEANPLQPDLRISFTLERDQRAIFDKFSAICTSRRSETPRTTATEILHEAERRGWDSLRDAHIAEWAKYWHDSDIQIEGDEAAQRALRFTTYHVLIAAPRQDEHVSIGAKTLSGPGYKGHVFWDTELFMLPILTFTQPKLARNLLMYRYHNLEGARHKAREAGFEGAMFPWESTDTGEETTPRWTNPYPDGKRIRIWTGDTEQHISTDVAYAVLQFWRWTGDDAFFANYGAEIVLDTAVFWGARAEYQTDKDRFELHMQIGPDEYHENIDNSVFTNSMVRWHLGQALAVIAWLEANHPDHAADLLARLHIDAARRDHWKQIIDKMFIPHDLDRGILEQFEGFFKLDPVNLDFWTPRVANMDYILGHEPTQHTRVIKQADVVMLMALLGDAVGSIEARRRNWDYYYPLVDHGSSLSPSTHAWVAARLGLNAEAYELFMFAGNIDLEDRKGNVRDGIHGAASGGVWEAAVFGFSGLHLIDGEFKIDPKLPDHWRSMSFRIYFRGKQHVIKLIAGQAAH